MKRITLLLPLAVTLAACAPAQTAASSEPSFGQRVLKGGQVWTVSGRTAEGLTFSFSQKLDDKPKQTSDLFYSFNANVVASEPKSTSPNYNITWRRATSSKSAAVEYLAAGGNNPYNGVGQSCFAINPSKSGSFTQFEGAVVNNTYEASNYLETHDASKLGTCTIALEQ